MTNLQKEKTQQAIISYCSAKEISKNELATRIGVSATTISKIVNGKWEGIDNKMWMQVWHYVNPEHVDGIFQTRDLKSVFDMCEKARKHHLMIGLCADTGMGKTTGITAYAKRKNVYYYYIDITVTPKIFLKSLLREMGVGFEGNLNEMVQRIADELNTQENPLVIFDECAKLSDKMMLILHSLRDKTIRNCGYILAGMPAFKNRLIKFVNKGATGYGEFYRRINMWHELRGLTREEINVILTENGITDTEIQREFRQYNRFGDLMNAINLHKSVND